MKQAKVQTRIFGGLGNQLFCYAAARRLALVNNAELIVDHVTGFTRDYMYQRQYQLDHFSIPARKATKSERLEPFSRIRRFLKRRLNQNLPFEDRYYIKQEGSEFEPRLLYAKPNGILYLEGYWQSESYFKDVESTIRKDLQIRSPVDPINLSVATEISNCTAVALHIRFFDAPGTQGTNNAPHIYYENALKIMETLVPAAHYFVFSENCEAARGYISLPSWRFTLVKHNQGDENAYADLWLMTLCKHFIIANSTFSWWGAWLSRNVDKIVIAPGFSIADGKMSWGFSGLLPSEWIKI
jgi:hypothetical protein